MLDDVIITIEPDVQKKRPYGKGPHKCNCAECGKPFETYFRKAFCSRACYVANEERKRVERRARVCEVCGDPFQLKPSGRNAGRACSRACGFILRARDQAAEVAARRVAQPFVCDHPPMPKTCEVCGAFFYSEQPNATKCSQQCRTEHQQRKKRPDRYMPRKCAVCGAVFTRDYRDRTRNTCSDECRHLRQIETGKPSKRAAKQRRRAQERGLYAESFDPFAVFKRDEWRCQICGVRTPKRLRGSYKDNAPELDHIIPLSLGGSHSYWNTQCACRKCNGDKGAKALGQMGLNITCA